MILILLGCVKAAGHDNKGFVNDEYKITISKLDLYGLEMTYPPTPTQANGDLPAKVKRLTFLHIESAYFLL